MSRIEEPLRTSPELSLETGGYIDMLRRGGSSWRETIHSYLDLGRNGIHRQLNLWLPEGVVYFPPGSYPKEDDPVVIVTKPAFNPQAYTDQVAIRNYLSGKALQKPDLLDAFPDWETFFSRETPQTASFQRHAYFRLPWPASETIPAEALTDNGLMRFLLEDDLLAYQQHLQSARVPHVRLDFLTEQELLRPAIRYRPFARPLLARGPQLSLLDGRSPDPREAHEFVALTEEGALYRTLETYTQLLEYLAGGDHGA